LEDKTVNTTPTKFFPQLEGLRAFAIVFVVMAHWQPDGNPYEYWIRWAGYWGINYFFVLSGFLIGQILLKENDRLKANEQATAWQSLKVFYMRRILRIFPTYYLLIAILLFIGFPAFIYKMYPWLLLYGSNFYIFQHGFSWPLTHLWTLAVEEHFYLVFPLLIFFIPKRFVIHAILLFGITGAIFRCCMYLLKVDMYSMLTPSWFDVLAIGVLLAYIKVNSIAIPYWKAILLLSLALYAFLPLPHFLYFKGRTFLNVLIPSSALLSMGIIWFASKGIQGPVKYLLENKVALYIGKIGYGLYLYHLLIPDLVFFIFGKLHYIPDDMNMIYMIEAIVLLTIASLSYYAIEKPLYSLKKHFVFGY